MSRKTNSQPLHRRDFRKRLFLICGFFGLYGFAIIGKLFYLQILQHRAFLAQSEKQYVRTVKIFYGRGKIFDRNGSELAANLEMESVYINPGDIQDKRYTARMLANVLGLDFSKTFKRIRSKKHFVWIKRKCIPQKIERLKQLGLPGVGFVGEQKRFYPKRELASATIGFVGLDNQGLAGVEHYNDSILRGITSLRIMEKDALGRSIRTGMSQLDPSNRSSDVVLTLDEVIQFFTEYELSKQVRHFRAKAGMALVMDPNSGEIYAMASVPQYNPNRYGAYQASYWRNPNVSSAYEPGSIFKPIVAAAALQAGTTKPNDIFFCENGSYRIGQTQIGEAANHKFGWLTLAGIIEKSSNKKFGFGEKAGIDLPGESRGQLRDLENWSTLSGPSISFGHEIGVTPIQMITAISAIANGGNLMHPRITRKIIHNGVVTRTFRPVIVNRAISTQVSRQMVDILKAVVQKGTGAKAAVPGFEVAGKTGTAQKFDKQTQAYSKNAYLSSFIGFVPADAPRLAILVMIDEPRRVFWGGDVAAPVFRNIAQRTLRYLNLPSKEERVFILNHA